jgi:hypothetical protein
MFSSRPFSIAFFYNISISRKSKYIKEARVLCSNKVMKIVECTNKQIEKQ